MSMLPEKKSRRLSMFTILKPHVRTIFPILKLSPSACRALSGGLLKGGLKKYCRQTPPKLVMADEPSSVNVIGSVPLSINMMGVVSGNAKISKSTITIDSHSIDKYQN